uniref:Uncharacterized protein n=1 Tax=Chromera velia CCMP2878 TaxID=1169474 RepID=A0A0G4G546_9ALVE|eukprot:Cvel_20336.t1-p1 / transcript=Cvel_20336.t1 / gene=Cvel_20336 / organism=Chromera_velia_CCMP2878 / gene_product=NHL repeat-containing protein 2, putative / transcript_product=NHL repeat-containing protein 2, putative / location=Cvel_scaffold1817:5551-10910(-) / protein_length=928 / sequence_SO=supercontig / SO=protein_coding / is_pseudo=false
MWGSGGSLLYFCLSPRTLLLFLSGALWALGSSGFVGREAFVGSGRLSHVWGRDWRRRRLGPNRDGKSLALVVGPGDEEEEDEAEGGKGKPGKGGDLETEKAKRWREAYDRVARERSEEREEVEKFQEGTRGEEFELVEGLEEEIQERETGEFSNYAIALTNRRRNDPTERFLRRQYRIPDTMTLSEWKYEAMSRLRFQQMMEKQMPGSLGDEQKEMDRGGLEDQMRSRRALVVNLARAGLGAAVYAGGLRRDYLSSLPLSKLPSSVVLSAVAGAGISGVVRSNINSEGDLPVFPLDVLGSLVGRQGLEGQGNEGDVLSVLKRLTGVETKGGGFFPDGVLLVFWRSSQPLSLAAMDAVVQLERVLGAEKVKRLLPVFVRGAKFEDEFVTRGSSTVPMFPPQEGGDTELEKAASLLGYSKKESLTRAPVVSDPSGVLLKSCGLLPTAVPAVIACVTEKDNENSKNVVMRVAGVLPSRSLGASAGVSLPAQMGAGLLGGDSTSPLASPLFGIPPSFKQRASGEIVVGPRPTGKVGGGALRFPTGVAVDVKGDRLFIADTGNHRVVVTTLEGKFVLQIGGAGVGWRDGSADRSLFRAPHGLWWEEEKQTLWVADTGNGCLRKISFPTGQGSSVWPSYALSSVTPGVSWSDPVELGSRIEDRNVGQRRALSFPLQVSGGDGELYVTAAGSHQIWRVNQQAGPDGVESLEPFLGSGVRGRRDHRDTLTEAVFRGGGLRRGLSEDVRLSEPVGITRLRGGQWVVSEGERGDLRWFNQDGSQVSTLIGGGGDQWIEGDESLQGDMGMPSPLPNFRWPSFLSTQEIKLPDREAEEGAILSDTFNHKLKVFRLSELGSEAAAVGGDLAGGGRPGSQDGSLKEALFNRPAQTACSKRFDFGAPRVWVADQGNHLIRVVDRLSETVETLQLSDVPPPPPS